MSHEVPRRALLSVSDKTGLTELATKLVEAGFELVSTGGTRRSLEQAGLPVTDVASLTGFPEMLDGRVKTLHPAVFGGILARADRPDDRESLAAHGIGLFQLVVVNLYPFEQTIAREGVAVAEAIEQIDIGGPSLVRAAAKNHGYVTVLTSESQYRDVMAALEQHGEPSTGPDQRRRLAAAAFAHTAAYDAAIAGYLHEVLAAEANDEQAAELDFPPTLPWAMHRHSQLRYGENPHQRAAFYTQRFAPPATLANAEQLHGKELSYNNLLDLDSALALVRGWPEPCCVVIKHNNPCGAATADDLAEAFRQAYAGDPVSAFGGILGFNREVDEPTAAALAEPGRFIEAIVAPSFSPEALEILTTKPKWRNNVRLLATGPMTVAQPSREFRYMDGGLLVQDRDVAPATPEAWECVTETTPDASLRAALAFAWHVVRQVKSNAIVVGRDQRILGVGAGQMSRVDSVRIALEKAREGLPLGVLASDAFFPFPDSIHEAATAGIVAIVQPGGSKQDSAVIEACNQHGIAMLFTGRRHFRH